MKTCSCIILMVNENLIVYYSHGRDNILFPSCIICSCIMKFQVVYPRQKKKGSSIQRATFFDIEDAIYWEKVINKQGIKETRIEVKD